ncbi:hypothetical protein [Roseibium alexandrii]|uniref:hypothetical protein n=1 Tax=Roseibium alexandrii TaxID=388408 RepID=UPI003750F7A2
MQMKVRVGRFDEQAAGAQSGIHGILAVGVAAEPEFEGAAEYLPIPQAYAHITAFGLGLEIEGPEARLNLRPHSAFQFGPAVEYRMGRDDVANDVIDRLEGNRRRLRSRWICHLSIQVLDGAIGCF